MKSNFPSFLQQASLSGSFSKKRTKLNFLDRTILNTAKAVGAIYLQAESADKENFIYKIDPRVKLISLISLAVVISVANNLRSQVIASAFIFLLFITGRLKITFGYKKIFFIAFIFGFLIMLPASLNVITQGNIVLHLGTFNRPLHFLIYNIPQDIGITDSGIKVVSLLFLRVFNTVSAAILIVFTTPFPSFIKAFRITGVPDTFLMIISLAYKYIFILSRTVEEAYFALKSRLAGDIKNNRIRMLTGGRIFFIYKRSHLIYEGTYNAMVSRGYHGEMKLYMKSKFGLPDIISLIVVIALGIAIILI